MLRIFLIATCAGFGGMIVGSSLSSHLVESQPTPVIAAMHTAPRASDMRAARVELAEFRAAKERAMHPSATTQAHVQRHGRNAADRAAL